jgi:hypothetical protein
MIAGETARWARFHRGARGHASRACLAIMLMTQATPATRSVTLRTYCEKTHLQRAWGCPGTGASNENSAPASG